LRFKKIFALLFLCLVLSFCLVGQTGCAPVAKNQPTQIRFWHTFSGKQQSILDMLVATYNATEGQKRNVEILPEYKTEDFIETYFNDSFSSSEQNFDYPEMAVVSDELACKAKNYNLIVNAEKYLSKQELDGYLDGFMQEGKITGTGETYIFPISKTSAVTVVNDFLWRSFYIDNKVDFNQWNSWKGISDLASRYYDWTEGKAFIAIESVQDYIFAYSAQHLPAMIQTGNKEVKINTNKETLRKIWDFYYEGVVNGYILQTENIIESLENGDIVAYIGSPHDSSYFPPVYKTLDGEEDSLRITAFGYPCIDESRNTAPHSGAGVCVFDYGDTVNKECYDFLHWFCSSENVIQFSAANNEISSYQPIYNKKSTKDYFKQLSDLDYAKYCMLNTSVKQVTLGNSYAPTGFIGYDDFCEELTSSLTQAAKEGLLQVKDLENKGLIHEEAVNQVCVEENFEKWYLEVIEIAGKY